MLAFMIVDMVGPAHSVDRRWRTALLRLPEAFGHGARFRRDDTDPSRFRRPLRTGPRPPRHSAAVLLTSAWASDPPSRPARRRASRRPGRPAGGNSATRRR